jgi:hypothetical protein
MPASEVYAAPHALSTAVGRRRARAVLDVKRALLDVRLWQAAGGGCTVIVPAGVPATPHIAGVRTVKRAAVV